MPSAAETPALNSRTLRLEALETVADAARTSNSGMAEQCQSERSCSVNEPRQAQQQMSSDSIGADSAVLSTIGRLFAAQRQADLAHLAQQSESIAARAASLLADDENSESNNAGAAATVPALLITVRGVAIDGRCVVSADSRAQTRKYARGSVQQPPRLVRRRLCSWCLGECAARAAVCARCGHQLPKLEVEPRSALVTIANAASGHSGHRVDRKERHRRSSTASSNSARANCFALIA